MRSLLFYRVTRRIMAIAVVTAAIVLSLYLSWRHIEARSRAHARGHVGAPTVRR